MSDALPPLTFIIFIPNPKNLIIPLKPEVNFISKSLSSIAVKLIEPLGYINDGNNAKLYINCVFF